MICPNLPGARLVGPGLKRAADYRTQHSKGNRGRESVSSLRLLTTGNLSRKRFVLSYCRDTRLSNTSSYTVEERIIQETSLYNYISSQVIRITLALSMYTCSNMSHAET